MLHSQGELKTPEFLERVTDYMKFFSDILEDNIVSQIGADGWAIYFTQVSPLTNHFFADIYVDDIKNVLPIKNVCETNIDSDFIIDYYHRGDLAKYLSF